MTDVGRVILTFLLAASSFADDPLPGRTKPPKGAKLVLEWSAVIDGTMLLHIEGREVKVVKGKSGKALDPTHRFSARLPRKQTWMYVEMTEGRGWAGVRQDPDKKNGYEAIVSVHDRGAGAAKIAVRIYHGPKPPPETIVAPKAGARPVVQRSRPAIQEGRFWGERGGPIRSLLPRKGEPMFSWEGTVESYAVLELAASGVVLHDCGLAGAKTKKQRWGGDAGSFDRAYLVLSVCDGPGRVRVIQRMNRKGSTPLIELDDRDVKGASAYRLEGYVVAKNAVDELYRASKASETAARLWTIEKLCMERAYPGETLNFVEKATLVALNKQEPVETLVGHNMVLAWPKDYLAKTPTKWRFLAELDAAMDWLEAWSGKDPVTSRGKRMVSRFRADKGGVALYVDFRLHIPRGEMRVPPDHGSYSHEVSHGFLYLPAICPTGRFNEGLTEVGRTSYWWFLGLEGAWRPFHARCMEGLRKHRDKGGTLAGVPSYGAAAGVYFALMERCCRDPGGDLDWLHFGRLLQRARNVEVSRAATGKRRFEIFFRTCGEVFGKDATDVLEALR